MGLNVASLCSVLTARPSLVLETAAGAGGAAGGGMSSVSAKSVAGTLAAWTSTVGMVEFLFNPTCGRLSDQYGRKALLLLGPAISLLLKLNVARPGGATRFNLALERIVGGAATTLSGSTICSAALSDMFPDKADLAVSLARLGSAAGAGVLLGPLLGGQLIHATGDARSAYLLGAAIATAQLVLLSTTLEETLAEGKRKVFDWARPFSNPLSFLRLYSARQRGDRGGGGGGGATGRDGGSDGAAEGERRAASTLPIAAPPSSASSLTSSLTSPSSSSSLPSRALPVLVTVAALQCCCEGKVLSDLNAIYLIAEGGLSIRQRASWLSLFGLAMVASGRMARVTIEVGGNAAGDGVVCGEDMCVLMYCACGVSRSQCTVEYDVVSEPCPTLFGSAHSTQYAYDTHT